MKKEEIDTSLVYGNVEQGIIDHSLGIMHKLVKSMDTDDVGDLSIDRTDSVLRTVESATNIVKKLSDTKLKIMGMKQETDDRARLINILTDINLRNNLKDGVRETEIQDSELIPVEIVTGELTDGIEQLSVTLLELEGESNNDD